MDIKGPLVVTEPVTVERYVGPTKVYVFVDDALEITWIERNGQIRLRQLVTLAPEPDQAEESST